MSDTVYTKKEILSFKIFNKDKDLILALVKNGEELSLSEIKNRIKTYKERMI